MYRLLSLALVFACSSVEPGPSVSVVAVSLPTSTSTPAAVVPRSLPKEEWRLLRPQPQANDLRAVFSVSESESYTVGERGTILATQDAGKHWSLQPSGTTENLLAVWARSSGEVYVAGENSTLLQSGDHGKTWSALRPTPQKQNFYAITGDEKRLFVAGQDIFSSLDGGKTWSIYERPGKARIFGLWQNKAGHLFGVGEAGLFLSSTDGVSFTEQRLKEAEYADERCGRAGCRDEHGIKKLNAIWGRAKELYVAGERGLFLRSVDNGLTWDKPDIWSPQKPNDYLRLESISGDAKNIYVAGSSGSLFYQSGTSAWRRFDSSDYLELYGVSRAPKGDKVYLVGQAGLITQGKTGDWSEVRQSQSTRQDFYAVWADTDGTVVVAGPGENNAIFQSKDFGATWTETQSPGPGLDHFIYAFWGDNAGQLYAVGEYGLVLSSSDKGSTWTSVRAASYQQEGLFSVHGCGKDALFASGRKGVVENLKTSERWMLDIQASLELSSLFCQTNQGGTEVFAGGYQKLFYSPDGGKEWRVLSLPQMSFSIEGLWRDTRGTLFISTFGRLFSTQDLGKTWKEHFLPWGPTIYDLEGLPDGKVYAVGSQGSILRSLDYGDTWEALVSGTHQDLRDLIIAKDRLYAVGRFGLVLSAKISD